ncbi:PAS domain-containing sensor histidine kinase [Emticicia sp. C21]|nr:PAS domain-containing sensor histidine kinase [Emticicia sp. C21]
MELIENKDLLQTVFDSAPNGIAVMRSVYNEKGRVEDFSILLFNAYTFNWIGETDYKGKRYGDVFPMVKETGILEKFIEVAETGVSANFERWYTGEGMNHWFRFTAVKHAELLVVTTEDITERKQAEIALQKALDAAEKQKRLYDSIINTTPDLVYVFDPTYRFTYANKALLNMWGKTAEEAIGKGLRDNGYEEWHALMHEREIDEVLASNKTIRGTVSFPHAELGSRVYDYIFGPVFNEKGEVEVIAGTTRDITELKHAEENLKQSEARFRNMIEQAPVAILLSRGEELMSESVNEPMVKFMNKSSADEIIGKTLVEALPELKDQPVLQIVLDVQKTGIPFRGDEQPVDFLIDGKLERRYFNLSYDVIKEPGKSNAVMHIAADVTEQVLARKKIEESENRYKTLSETLEQQVNDRTKELQRSNEDLQQFAHVASHDLKEPVRKIKTFTNRLEDHLKDPLDETAARFIERIHVAADRMKTMIDGVLTYSTINENMQKSEWVNLNEVIKNIETDLEVALQKTGGAIFYHTLPTVEGASVLLYQLFYNLINNSIKFAREGILPKITISSELMIEDNRNFARIMLRDNGIGFEPDQAGQIFETFTRLNSKDKYEGTGLGLSLCKKIVERHDGSIIANGTPGEGATFIIKLPFQQKETRT